MQSLTHPPSLNHLRIYARLFLWDKKAVPISSAGVHNLFIIKNEHTRISERSQGGFSGTDPVQIRGTVTVLKE